MRNLIKGKRGGVLLFGRYFVDEELIWVTWMVAFVISLVLYCLAAVNNFIPLAIPLALVFGIPLLIGLGWAVRAFFRRWRNVFRGIRSEDGGGF